MDLVYGMNLLQISHDSKIDWLELNETGHKLLFRDKKMKLTLMDTRTSQRNAILSYCTFVQVVLLLYQSCTSLHISQDSKIAWPEFDVLRYKRPLMFECKFQCLQIFLRQSLDFPVCGKTFLEMLSFKFSCHFLNLFWVLLAKSRYAWSWCREDYLVMCDNVRWLVWLGSIVSWGLATHSWGCRFEHRLG